MHSFNIEEIARGLEEWLKARRDENENEVSGDYYNTIDVLLKEARDCAAEGWLPWQKMDDPTDGLMY